jgi:tripartite-type tricarboxylate transporter receptor subunit TctC
LEKKLKPVLYRLGMTLTVVCLPAGGSYAAQSSAPSSATSATTYPAKPVRILVPFAAGGAVDTTGRLIGQKLSESFGRPVVVENRPGAAGMIAVDTLLKAPADGYTLMIGAAGVLATTPAGQEKPTYDPLKDVAPVTLVATFPFMLVVNPSLPARSVAELVKLARAKPLAITNATTGHGTATHLVAEYLSLSAGIKLTHVPYKGDNPAVMEIIAGQISMGMLTPIIMVQHVKSGRLRALAVTSAARFPPLPDVPTVAESGYPGFDAESWHAVVVRAGTPADIVRKLNGEIVRILKENADVRVNFESAGGAIVAGTPEEFGAYLRREIAKWGKVIKAAGLKPQ